MDNFLEKYIENLLMEVVSQKNLLSLPEDQRNPKILEIRNELQTVVLDTILRAMSDEQLQKLKELDYTNKESLDTIAELIAQIPDLDQTVQQKLEQKAQELVVSPV